jgi:signal transduction histidine kinase
MRKLAKKIFKKKSKPKNFIIPIKKDVESILDHKANQEPIFMVADKLKTPLGSIRWNTEKILKNSNEYDLPAEVIDLIKKNYQSNLELIDLVDKIVKVSKINKGKKSSKIERFSLSDLIKEIIKDINPEAKLKDVVIKFRVNKDHRYSANMNRAQIKEAICNIINNAVKYSFKKSQVLVSLNKKEKFFEIKTSNIGIGVPSTDYDHIFKKFVRAKNAIKLGEDGLGLGLFIAKSFLETVDGSISFYSSKGKRTVFIVRIPVSITK